MVAKGFNVWVRGLWTPLDPSPISNTDYLGHLNLGYVKYTHRRDEFLPLLHPF